MVPASRRRWHRRCPFGHALVANDRAQAAACLGVHRSALLVELLCLRHLARENLLHPGGLRAVESERSGQRAIARGKAGRRRGWSLTIIAAEAPGWQRWNEQGELRSRRAIDGWWRNALGVDRAGESNGDQCSKHGDFHGPLLGKAGHSGNPNDGLRCRRNDAGNKDAQFRTAGYPASRMATPPDIASNRRLRLRVVHKLFLLLALAVTLALGALGGLTLLNLRSGFVAYVNALDLARLAPLAKVLDQRDDAPRGFDGLRDRAAWEPLLQRTLEPGPPRVPPRAPPLLPRGGPPPPHAPPGDDRRPPESMALPLAARVTLLNAQRQRVVGAPYAANALLRPLEQGGLVVGWLALQPLTRPVDSRDTDFLAAQVHDMLRLAVLLLLLALVVAWLFARHLLSPLRAVERAADQLASGEYVLHLDTSRRDELGDLVRHVNRLGTALQLHESARRRWVADISHELRTPLSIVRGEVEAMQDGMRPMDASGLRSLHEEVMRLDRLVGDLHQLSMADLGTLSYHFEACHLGDLLRDACSRFEGMATDAGLTLTQDLTPAMVRADPDRLRQLIDNLLGNSLRYSDPGGRINVALAVTGTIVCVVFDDTPPGVATETLARLFEPLYRGELSRNRASGGSGLGLAIAERIALAHGGQLHACPSPLGGLRLTLTLPLLGLE